MGLLPSLGNLVAPLAGVVSGNQEGQKIAQQDAFARALLQRQQDEKEQAAELARRIGDQRINTMKSQATAADALAISRGNEPGEYKQATNGEWYWLPRRMPTGDAATLGRAVNRGANSPPSGDDDPFAVKPWTLNGPVPRPPRASSSLSTGSGTELPFSDEFSAEPTAIPPATPSTSPSPGAGFQRTQSPQQGQPQMPGVRATGLIGPQKPGPRPPAPHATTATIGGRQVLGHVDQSGLFAPDTTAQGDTVYGKPLAGAGSDTQLNHSINNVRAQITQTQAQITAAQRRATAAAQPFVSPAQQQDGVAAGLQLKKLRERLDSLQGVHDHLNARQQQGLSGPSVPPVPLVPPGPPVPPAPANKNLGGSTTGAPSGRLDAATAKQMQDEFAESSRNLQAILSSGAPEAVKKQARDLYQQHQIQIARRYGAVPPASDDNE